MITAIGSYHDFLFSIMADLKKKLIWTPRAKLSVKVLKKKVVRNIDYVTHCADLSIQI